MALKGDRTHIQSDVSFYSTAVAERGGIMSHLGTVASGVAMDQAGLTASYVANPSGVSVPIGVLISEVVNLDLTRQHRNWHQDQVQVGQKMTIWPKGEVVTNYIYPGQTPTPGAVAFVGHSGYICSTKVINDVNDPLGLLKKVGKFVTGKDEDGYCRVQINLP